MFFNSASQVTLITLDLIQIFKVTIINLQVTLCINSVLKKICNCSYYLAYDKLFYGF